MITHTTEMWNELDAVVRLHLRPWIASLPAWDPDVHCACGSFEFSIDSYLVQGYRLLDKAMPGLHHSFIAQRQVCTNDIAFDVVSCCHCDAAYRLTDTAQAEIYLTPR